MSFINKTTFIDTFLREMAEISHFSAHTLRAYATDLNQIFNYKQIPFTLTESEILKAVKLAQISWGSLELASRQRKAACARSFLDWLYRKEFISEPLSELIEMPKVPRKIPHYISVDEVFRIFEYLENLDQTQLNHKYYLILFLLLYGGGLRVSEACNLSWNRIRWERGDVCILGKGGKERWVALPRKTMNSLSKLPKSGEFIWGLQPLNSRKAYDWIRNLGQSSGLIVPLHPHALRHSYATHLLTSGMNLRTLQELMGHSSLTSTEKYLHLTTDQLARTLANHHPLGDNKIKK